MKDNQNAQIFKPSVLMRLAGTAFGAIMIFTVASYAYYQGTRDILMQIALGLIGLWLLLSYNFSYAKVDEEGITIQKIFLKRRHLFCDIDYVLYEEFGFRKRRKTVYLTFFKKEGNRHKTEWEFIGLEEFLDILELRCIAVKNKYDHEDDDTQDTDI